MRTSQLSERKSTLKRHLTSRPIIETIIETIIRRELVKAHLSRV